MIKIASLPVIAAALLACGLSAAPAQPGPNRTWVSGGNRQRRVHARRTLQDFRLRAHQDRRRGEIDVLDPAGYGMVTITKAISIVNDGVGAATIGTSSAVASRSLPARATASICAA